ncbi:MAG: hypothetical protein Q8927_20145, partial [Bacteroidota bacterium]|nr:hypothetical protein [Bacteroidota bacterium]
KNIRTEIYHDLINDRVKINAWQAPEMYPIDLCTERELEGLKKHMAIEFCMQGTNSDRSIFDALFQDFYKKVQVTIEGIGKPAYLFTCSFKPDIRSPLRTYKGLLPKDLKNKGFQLELDCDEKYSVFGGLVKIEKENFANIREGDFFVDSQTSFILLSLRQSIFSKSTVEDILSNCMIHASRSYINYLKLINSYCAEGDVIRRMAGDGGDRYISFQIFFRREEESTMLGALSI